MTPSYVQAGREDHIAPPQSVWKIMGHFAGPKRFVLAGSGHIAGMINPPAANKYFYWTNAKLGPDADAWFEGAEQHEGSWWPEWRQWISAYLEREVPARVPGKGKLPILEAAPGSYARLRADDSGD